MILNYQNQVQLLDDWCWAAVTSSVAFNYNPSAKWTQAALAADLLDNSCSIVNQNNAGTAPQICHQQYDIQAALSHINNYAWMVERYLTFDEINYQINNGWPVCCQIFWPAYNQSHYIAIYGYDGDTIIIGDPEAGVCSLDYNSLTGSYRAGQWIKSFGTQPAQ
jgi:hypothetical protein